MPDMAGLREALIAALKSLLKGKSFIEALIAFWFNPTSCKQDDQQPQPQSQPQQTPTSTSQPPSPSQPQRQSPNTQTARSTAASTATPSSTSSSSSSSFPRQRTNATSTSPLPSPSPAPSKQQAKSTEAKSTEAKSLAADFLAEAERLLLHPVQDDEALQQLVAGLKAQFRDRLLHNAACMLPSYICQLPTGTEHGRFLSLDVGGSTLRVALIELLGGGSSSSSSQSVAILGMESFKITPAIKQLAGTGLFDWMAARIVEVVDRVGLGSSTESSSSPPTVLPMGLAWSFPIEQTSLHGGRLQSMGKGFRAADALAGQDVGDLLQTACARQGLRTTLAAIVNDSAACLLAQAYTHAATRFGLILGTGVNIAVHLPVAAVGLSKFGARPPAWFAAASHVVVNTELGMFGHDGVLPTTAWDARLNAAHVRPDFQPLEHMVSGMYLGEVCRYALLDAAADEGNLFGGAVPPSLLVPYSLDTETLSRMAADTTEGLADAFAVFCEAHPAPPTAARPISTEDVRVVHTLARYIAQRSAALVAASVYALWSLKADAEREVVAAGSDSKGATAATAELAILHDHTVVSFNGSVIERYPRYRATCQGVIDRLLAAAGDDAGSIELVPAHESSLIGAAVALSCAEA